mgnify:CR=1 FL=1
MTQLLFKILRFSGLPFLVREIIQRNRVTILMFHDISRDVAERVFSYLSKHYNFINLNDYLNACHNGNQSKLPEKALIITFDDGHIRNYELLPVIKKYNIPVTIFLCAGIVNTNRHYWFLHNRLNGSSGRLKNMANQQRLTYLAKQGFYQDKEYDTPQALTKKQIEEMRTYVNFQAHTIFHPCLPTCSDDESWKEISESKEVLENEFGLNINALAYPNGDHTAREVQLSKQAGYTCAVTTKPGFNTLQSDLFRLKRLSVNDTNDLNELIVKASGVWGFFKQLGRKI